MEGNRDRGRASDAGPYSSTAIDTAKVQRFNGDGGDGIPKRQKYDEDI